MVELILSLGEYAPLHIRPLRSVHGKERHARLGKALDYQMKETDPFRYAADDAPGTWCAKSNYWSPVDPPVPERSCFRIVVGPDYVGEWKAKNGK